MGLLMRRSEAMRELGVGWRVFGKLIETKAIRPRYATPNGRALFWREEVRAVAEHRKKCKERK